MKLLWVIYNLGFPVVFLLAAPFYLTRMRKRGQVGYLWKERFGFFDEEVRNRLEKANRPIWIHAVSVGEVKLAEALIRELRQDRPWQSIVLSTTTITGRRLAEALQDDDLTVVFHTVDLWSCVKRAFDLIDPSLVVLVEQELWLNQVVMSTKRKVPVWVINSRLSDRSRQRFLKFRSVLRPFLAMLDFIGVQSEQEIERFSSCGFPAHRLFNTGSMKYDVVPPLDEGKQRLLQQYVRNLGWDERDLVILGGSTHAHEEEMLLKVCEQLEPDRGRIRIVLVPRHAERAEEVAMVCKRFKKAYILKSSSSEVDHSSVPDVLIADTTGELSGLYGIADINIIGKSFYGVGGQNFLEAARFPNPIVVGPEMSNFKETVEAFRTQNALLQVQNEDELRQVLQVLIRDEKMRCRIGETACQLVETSRGAARKQAAMVAGYLKANGL